MQIGEWNIFQISRFFDLVNQEGFYPKYILVYIHSKLNKVVQL